MANIADVTVLDGGWTAEKPAIIIDAATARRAVADDAATDLLLTAIEALLVSGKQVVYVEEAAPGEVPVRPGDAE